VNGPGHYKEAERLIAVAAEGGRVNDVQAALSEAQVHATLAHVAATVMEAAMRTGAISLSETSAWHEAIKPGPGVAP
jgi:hypothetical protein